MNAASRSDSTGGGGRVTGGPLPTKALGASGIPVGAQGLGCMGISDAYGPSDLLDPIADKVAGDRYAVMSFTSVGRE